MVKHRRYTPFKREFSYPIFMLYLDINDLDSVMKKSLFWNVDKPAVVSFNRKDFHNVETKSFDKANRKLDILRERHAHQSNETLQMVHPFHNDSRRLAL